MSCLHEFGDLDLKYDTSFIVCLFKAPFVFALVGLPNTTVQIVNGNLLLLLLICIHLVVLLEHGHLLLVDFSLFFLGLLLHVDLSSELLGIAIVLSFTTGLLQYFLLNVLAGASNQILSHGIQSLLSGKLLTN